MKQSKILDKILEYSKESVPTNTSGCGTPELQDDHRTNPKVINVKVKRNKNKK